MKFGSDGSGICLYVTCLYSQIFKEKIIHDLSFIIILL